MPLLTVTRDGVARRGIRSALDRDLDEQCDAALGGAGGDEDAEDLFTLLQAGTVARLRSGDKGSAPAALWRRIELPNGRTMAPHARTMA
jgi:hypothetical protein